MIVYKKAMGKHAQTPSPDAIHGETDDSIVPISLIQLCI